MSSLLIKNAQLANGEITNIFIKNELIYDLTSKYPLADKRIDVEGKFVMPGVIDPHVHFRVPGSEYKEDWISGSRAAVAGGVTTVLDMPNNNPATTTNELLDKKRRLIRGQSFVNYGLYIGVTKTNLKELKNAMRVAGIKVYLGSSTGDLLVDDYEILANIIDESEHLIVCHSEDEQCLKIKNVKCKVQNYIYTAHLHDALRSEDCAAVSAQKVVDIVSRIKKPVYFCHISGLKEIEILKEAKIKGLPIFIEATPHHLFLSQDEAKLLGNRAKVNPPIRNIESQWALQKALAQGFIDTIGTDHAPHTLAEKRKPYEQSPAGFPGLETMLPLMLHWYSKGGVTLQSIQELTSWKPASIFKILNRGVIAPGYFADLVISDLNLTKSVTTRTLYTKCKWSPFKGRFLTGFPVMTVVNGNVVYAEGRIIGKPKGQEVFK